MNRLYSINIYKEKWSLADENYWFYPKTKRYNMSLKEIPYFLLWLSKSKNINSYFKKIAFSYDLTKNGLYFGYFKTDLVKDGYPKVMYSRFLKCNESNKILVLNTLINSLDCEVILNLYKPNNLNLYFPLSHETSKYFKEIFDEIIYEDIFCGGIDYSPSILGNFKKHGAENFARKLAKKRYKHEKRRLHSNLGNRRGSKFDTEWKQYCKKRDNYTCQCCGSKRNIVVHHKNGYYKFPTLRTAKSNGVVLCEECHRLYHSEYGRYAEEGDFREVMLRFSV